MYYWQPQSQSIVYTSSTGALALLAPALTTPNCSIAATGRCSLSLSLLVLSCTRYSLHNSGRGPIIWRTSPDCCCTCNRETTRVSNRPASPAGPPPPLCLGRPVGPAARRRRAPLEQPRSGSAPRRHVNTQAGRSVGPGQGPRVALEGRLGGARGAVCLGPGWAAGSTGSAGAPLAGGPGPGDAYGSIAAAGLLLLVAAPAAAAAAQRTDGRSPRLLLLLLPNNIDNADGGTVGGRSLAAPAAARSRPDTPDSELL